MNKKEYSNSKIFRRNIEYKQVQSLLKDWKSKNNIVELCDVHHRDDTEECIKYNNEHYELWGHEIDEIGNLKFEPGKYVQFLTHVEHSRYHNAGNKNPFYGKKHTRETCAKISAANKVKHMSDEAKKKISIATTGENNPFYGKKHSNEVKAKISAQQKGYSLLWNVYKSNDGAKSYNEFRKAVKSGDITFEMQPISVFIN